MDFYTTASLAKLFDVAPQTIKNWARVFANYLSPSAKPETGKKRLFTTDDLKVFALAHEYHARGLSYDDAHLALRAGQRGDIPGTITNLTTTVPPALLTTLREEIGSLRLHLKTAESERDKERGKVELLEKILADKEQQIKALYTELAEEKSAHKRADG